MKMHIVQKGDTLWKLSKKYGVDFETLKSANEHLTNPDLIMPGMKINIPTVGIPNPKQVSYQGEDAPITKEQPLKKEVPQIQPIEAMPSAKKEMKKKVPAPPPTVAPTPTPPPEQKPTYQMQQAKMNVNIYKQPAAAPKVPMPPPAKKPKELPKKPISKPEPKVAPKEMVVPKPVKKLPEKKKPVAKPKPQPMPVPPPMPIQQPIYPISPVTEGCIPLSVLCGCQPYNMWPQGQPMQMPVMSPYAMQQPMYMMPYYPQQASLMPSQHMMYRHDEREDLVEDEPRTVEYGDLTEERQQPSPYHYNPHDAFYRMMPWTYPVSAQHCQEDPVEDNEDS